jgi:hypothetical protein
MLVVETVARIRREFYVKGKSIKEIVRSLGVSRNTVRKVLRSGETAFAYERTEQPLPKLGPWASDLDGLLAANAGKARRERLTLMRIYEKPRLGGRNGGRNCCMETLHIGNDMIGGRNHQNGLRIATNGQMGRQGYGGCGVAALRLKNDSGWRAASFRKLVTDQETVLFTADNYRRGKAERLSKPRHGRLHHRMIANDRQQLFGMQRPRCGPQPGARTSRKNDRHQMLRIKKWHIILRLSDQNR